MAMVLFVYALKSFSGSLLPEEASDTADDQE